MATVAKISSKSKKVIQQISQETGESQIAIIDHAVMAYQRERRMHKINVAYAKIQKHPKQWQEELEERSILEGTSEDGLEEI